MELKTHKEANLSNSMKKCLRLPSASAFGLEQIQTGILNVFHFKAHISRSVLEYLEDTILMCVCVYQLNVRFRVWEESRRKESV